MFAIEINDLKKSYGSNFGLKNIELTIERGKVFALLGPNGAGKTTIVKCILDLLLPDNGKILINGISSVEKLSRKDVAFIPEKFSFFSYYTVYSALEFYCDMKGVDIATRNEVIDHALSELKISELKDRKLKTLSKGQLQRTGLATLLIGNNDLMILDEPFSGLDPIGMKDLKDLIRKLKSEGKTIFINSHILSEMEQLADEFAIINKGELLFKGSIAEIHSKNTSLEDFFYQLVGQSK